MGVVSFSLPSDGAVAKVADYNTPLTLIANVINGNIDNNNISTSAAIAGSKLGDATINLETKALSDSGWRPVSDTWTFASSTTITVPSDATLKYSVGDKLRLTQSSSTKYFYVVAVAATVLTVSGGTDYTVANAAISSISYSKAENPLGHPLWFNYTPTFTGFSASPTATGTRFCINGRTATVNYSCLGGTSNNANSSVSLPVTAATSGLGSYIRDGWLRAQDNGSLASTPGIYEFDIGATTFNIYKDQSGGAWTSTGTKGFRCSVVYEI